MCIRIHIDRFLFNIHAIIILYEISDIESQYKYVNLWNRNAHSVKNWFKFRGKKSEVVGDTNGKNNAKNRFLLPSKSYVYVVFYSSFGDTVWRKNSFSCSVRSNANVWGRLLYILKSFLVTGSVPLGPSTSLKKYLLTDFVETWGLNI